MESILISFRSISPLIPKIWEGKSFPKASAFVSLNNSRVFSCDMRLSRSLQADNIFVPCSSGRLDFSLNKIYSDNADSVVRIRNLKLGELLNKKTGKMEMVEIEDVSSGIIWDHEGHILTNYHCIDGSHHLSIQIEEGRQSLVKVLAVNKECDVALLYVDNGERLKPIQKGTSNDLLVGQAVYAIGHQIGSDKSFTAGIVSGLNRSVPSRIAENDCVMLYHMIQINAVLSRGNSGGPLLDSSCRLIGMNTCIHDDNCSFGICFAIPVDDLINHVEKLLMRAGNSQTY